MIPFVLALGGGFLVYWGVLKVLEKTSPWRKVLAGVLAAGIAGVGGFALDALRSTGVLGDGGKVVGTLQDKGQPAEPAPEELGPPQPAPPEPDPLDGAPPSPITPSRDDNTIGGTYVVEKGDTIYSLAKRAGVSIYSLAGVNPAVGPDYKIFEGQVLNIPCPNIDTAGPGAPKSVGCAASIEKAFGNQNRNNQNPK